jgi:hypothetical protein
MEKLWDPVLVVGNESPIDPVDLSHISSHGHSRQDNEPAEGLHIGVSRYEKSNPTAILGFSSERTTRQEGEGFLQKSGELRSEA